VVMRQVGRVPRVVVGAAYVEEACALIARAEESIEVVTYAVSPVRAGKGGKVALIFGGLASAARRGVAVRVLFERSPRERAGPRSASRAVEVLKAANVAARLGPGSLRIHGKVMVFDRTYVLSGSHNLTERSLGRNWEVSTLVGHKAIGTEMALRFERLWERAGRFGGK